MHVWVDVHSNPTKILDFVCFGFHSSRMQSFLWSLTSNQNVLNGVIMVYCWWRWFIFLWLDFPKSFFSLVLHQIVKFNGQFNECCPTDGIKRKMTRNFKEINTPSDLNHYLFDELFSVASNSSSFVWYMSIDFTSWTPTLTKDDLLEDAVTNSIEGTSHNTKRLNQNVEKEKSVLWKDKFVLKIQIDLLLLRLFL